MIIFSRDPFNPIYFVWETQGEIILYCALRVLQANQSILRGQRICGHSLSPYQEQYFTYNTGLRLATPKDFDKCRVALPSSFRQWTKEELPESVAAFFQQVEEKC